MCVPSHKWAHVCTYLCCFFKFVHLCIYLCQCTRDMVVPIRELGVLISEGVMYMELGPEDVSLLERCPHFMCCYVQASIELGPEDMSLLERCPHFSGCCICTGFNAVVTWRYVAIRDVSLFQMCVNLCCLHTHMYVHSCTHSLTERSSWKLKRQRRQD